MYAERKLAIRSNDLGHISGVEYVIRTISIDGIGMPAIAKDNAFLWKMARAAEALTDVMNDGTIYAEDVLQIMLIALLRLHRNRTLETSRNPKALALTYCRNAARDFLRKQHCIFRSVGPRTNRKRTWEKKRFEPLPYETTESDRHEWKLPLELIVKPDLVAAMDLMMPTPRRSETQAGGSQQPGNKTPPGNRKQK